MLDNKKGQIAETMTWVVATIAIVVVLIISIYIVSILSVAKKEIKYNEYERETDLILEKSIFAYFLLEESDRIMLYDELVNLEFFEDLDDKIDEVGGNL